MVAKIVFLILFLFWSFATPARAGNPDDFRRKSVRTNQTAMWILGSWAVGNIISGTAGMSITEGPDKYFHQMNVMWNSVNLGIATAGLLSQKPKPDLSTEDFLATHRKTENLYLINSALDILYISSGVYMVHRSGKSTGRPELMEGYGKSVILQGGFLLIFDTAFWLIQRRNRINFPGQISLAAGPDYRGLQVSVSF